MGPLGSNRGAELTLLELRRFNIRVSPSTGMVLSYSSTTSGFELVAADRLADARDGRNTDPLQVLKHRH